MNGYTNWQKINFVMGEKMMEIKSKEFYTNEFIKFMHKVTLKRNLEGVAGLLFLCLTSLEKWNCRIFLPKRVHLC